ncbi:MAG: hypothetical protein AMXMBFR13_34770 [Phycisphaerae bacterium]
MKIRFPWRPTRVAAGLTLSLTIVSLSIAQTTAPAVLTESRRAVDELDERVSVLSNGLTVILKAHRAAPVVTVRMYCRTGSIYEQEYLGSGMSHLFEHLLHGGETTTRSAKQSTEILNAIGGNTNAYTSYDVTCYFINTTREHLATAVGLLGDWLTHPTFPQEAFDREWDVVQRELERDLDSPESQLHDLTMETLFREHPARYPIIGHQPIVQTLTKEDIIGYHRRMYVPDNLVVCIAGDIVLDDALAAVAQEFAGFQRRRVPTIVLPEEPAMSSPRTATKRMKVETAILRLGWPSIPLIHEDLYALDVLSYVLTQGDSSRLARAVRDQGLTYTIDSSSWTPAWARGIFTITARLAPEQIEPATKAILEQIARLQGELVSPEELRQAQRQKAAEQIFATQTAESVGEMMANDFLASGDIHFGQHYVDRIQEVTAEQIREMARKYLVPQRLATMAVLPEGGHLATGEPKPSKKPSAIRKITLENGLRCLIQADSTSPVVAIQSFSLGGVLFEDGKTNGLSRLAALTAPRGTAQRTAEEIARFFDLRGGAFSSDSGNNSIYFQAQVLKPDFEEALDVFADVVCNPAFPAAELDNIRRQVLDQIRQVDEYWRSELVAYFQSCLFQASPYRFLAAGSPEVVSAATPEQVAAFYRRRVTGPDTVLVIFGDVDPAAAELLVRRLFQKLPPREVELPTPPADEQFSRLGLYVKRKPPQRGVAGICIGFPGMRVGDRADVVPMAVLDTIISGYRYPTGWLFEELRGAALGLVYEVHAQNVPGLLPGYFAAYAACQPDQVNRVYGIMTQQLDKARNGAFSTDELDRAKTIIATSELMEQQTPSERAMQSALDELYGLGYDYRPRFLQAVRQTTREDVQRVAQKYLASPAVAVVTPAPEHIDLGMKPLRVDEEATAAPAKEETP